MPTKGYNTVYAVPKEVYARYVDMTEGPFSAVKTIKVDQFNLNTGQRPWTSYARHDNPSKQNPKKSIPKHSKPPTPPNQDNYSLLTDDGWDGLHSGASHFYTTNHDNPWGGPPITSITQHDHDPNNITNDNWQSQNHEFDRSNYTDDHWRPPTTIGQREQNLLPIFVAPPPTTDAGVQVNQLNNQGTYTNPILAEHAQARGNELATQTELPPQTTDRTTQAVNHIASRGIQAGTTSVSRQVQASNPVATRSQGTIPIPSTSQATQSNDVPIMRDHGLQANFQIPMWNRPSQTNPQHVTNQGMQVHPQVDNIATQTTQRSRQDIPPPPPPPPPSPVPQLQPPPLQPPPPPPRNTSFNTPSVADRSRSMHDYSTRLQREDETQVQYKPYHRFRRPPLRAVARPPIQQLPPLPEETSSYADTRKTLIDSSAPYGLDENLVDPDLQFLPMLDITPDSTIDYNDFQPPLSSTPIPDITPDVHRTNPTHISISSTELSQPGYANPVLEPNVGAVPRVIPCQYCPFTTHSRAIMGDHIQNMHSTQINQHSNTPPILDIAPDVHRSNPTQTSISSTEKSQLGYANPALDPHTDADMRVIPCQYCPFTTHSRAIMGDHIQDMHSTQINEHSNTSITRQTVPVRNLVPIRNVVNDPTTIPCVHCPFRSRTRAEMDAHVEECHSDQYMCDYCNFTSADALALVTHNRQQHPQELNASFNCGKCDFKTKDIEELVEHIRCDHGGGDEIPTSLEDQDFYNSSSSHDNSRPDFNCLNCSYVGTSGEDLLQHINRNHGANTTPNLPLNLHEAAANATDWSGNSSKQSSNHISNASIHRQPQSLPAVNLRPSALARTVARSVTSFKQPQKRKNQSAETPTESGGVKKAKNNNPSILKGLSTEQIKKLIVESPHENTKSKVEERKSQSAFLPQQSTYARRQNISLPNPNPLSSRTTSSNARKRKREKSSNTSLSVQLRKPVRQNKPKKRKS